MRSDRLRCIGLLLMGLVVLLGGCRRQGTTLGRIRAERVVRIGTDATYPPFETVRAGQYSGFDVELGNAIAGELGGKAEWVNTSFDGIFPALDAEKFDLVMSAVTITDERKKRLLFSDPYYTAGQIVAIRDGNEGAKGLQDLDGKLAGIQINTTATEVLKKYPQIRVRQYPSLDLALQDLENGNLAAVVGDAPTTKYFLAHGFSKLSTVGTLLTEEHYGIVMRAKDRELQQAVNTALAKLRADGRFAALEAKWFGAEAQSAPVASGTPWGLILRTLGVGLKLTLLLTALGLLFGLPLGLTVALARMVKHRVVAWPFNGYVELFRGTPLLVQIIFIYYALPQLLGVNLPGMTAAVLALSLNSGAYISEIFRAGIQSIDTGQMEAARSLGMSYPQGMRYVVLPQAVRRVLPPLTNEAIALLKDSSLISVIGMAELTRAGQELSSQLAIPLVVWPVVALFYLAITFPLTRLAALLERKWRVNA